MIKNKVAEVAVRKGLKNAYELKRDAGLSPTVAYALWNGEARAVSFETLDKLCALFKCQPGLLFERQDGRE